MLNKKFKKVVASVTMFATVVALSGVSMLAPIAASAATTIVDGDLISSNATNSDGTPTYESLDTYIVKIVGEKKFKRLVLNPTIFNSYQHLKWENIKEVDQATVDSYTTSSLARVDGNDKVYALTPNDDDGNKSWINLSAADFLGLDDSDPDSIYTINATDGATYEALGDIDTVAALEAFYEDGTLPEEVEGGDLKVSLSASTPESTTLIVDDTANNGQGYAPFMKLKFAAGSDGAVEVKTLKLKRSGIPSADTDLSNVQMYIGDEKIADYSSFSSGVITFNDADGLFTVPAKGSKEVTITADVADAVTGTKNVVFSVVSASDIVTDGGDVDGSFPIVGNSMSITDIGANLLGTAVLATVSNGSGTEPGTTEQELWKFRITGANKKVDLEKIKFTMIGTIDTDDIENIKLYQGSTKLGEVSGMDDDKTVTFDISGDPFEIDKVAKDFSLKGDIIGGTNRTYQFSVQSMDDVTVVDNENDVRIKAGSADSWTVIQAAAATTISTGSLTVVKTPNVATGNIAKGATDQVLASFDFKATGEPIKVTSIYVEANSSSDLGIHDAKLFVDGSQIGTAADLTDDTTATFAIGNSLVIPAGVTKTVEVRGDVKATGGGDTYTANDTIAIYLSSTSAGGANGNACAYQRTISMGTANVGGVAGYTRTVKSGVLVTAKNTAVADYTSANPVGVAGATGVKLGSFVATVGAGEAVYIDDVQITDASAAFSQVQNLKVKVNGTEIGTTIAAPVTTTTYTFTANPRIEVAASSNVLIEVYGDIKSGGSLTTGDMMVLSQVSATGKNTSADAKDDNDRNGQDIISAAGGALTVALGGNTPASAILVMGSASPVAVADFTFEETTGAEDMTITELKVINTLTTDTNLVEYSLWDGSAQVGTTQITSTSGVVTFSNLSLKVAKSTTKTLTVKAKANSYPNATAGAENIVEITAGTTYVTAEGVTTGPQTVTVASNLDGNIFEVYRTNLTAVKGTVTGDGSTGRSRSSSQAISQVKFVADAAYAAKIRASYTSATATEGTDTTNHFGVAAVTTAGQMIDGSAMKVLWTGAGEAASTIQFPVANVQNYKKVSFWMLFHDNTGTDALDASEVTAFTSTDATVASGQGTALTISDPAEDTWVYVTLDVPTGTAAADDVFGIQFNGTAMAAAGATAAGDYLIIDNVRFYNDSIVVDLSGDLGAVATTTGSAVTLKDASSTTKMTGYVSASSTSAATVTLLGDSEISVSSAEQVLTIYGNTTTLTAADASGVTETLNVGIDLGNASTAGDISWYDGAVTATSPIKWVSGTTPVSFNFGY